MQIKPILLAIVLSSVVNVAVSQTDTLKEHDRALANMHIYAAPVLAYATQSAMYYCANHVWPSDKLALTFAKSINGQSVLKSVTFKVLSSNLFQTVFSLPESSVKWVMQSYPPIKEKGEQHIARFDVNAPNLAIHLKMNMNINC